MQYIEQSIDSVQYALLEGNFDVSQFRSLQSRTITAANLTCTITIIGESHVLRIVDNDTQKIFWEICACVEPQVAGVHQLIPATTITQLPPVKHKLTENRTYTFEHNLTTLSEAESRHASWSHNDVLLTQYFPDTTAHVTAITALTITATDTTTTLQTIHTYPNENQALYTRSHLTLS